MRLSHRFTVPARVEDVWAAFNQLKRVAPHFPGATLDSVRGDDFIGSIKIKFGPSLLLYNGSGRIVERNQADRQLIIEARGRDRRGQGGATAVLTGRFTGLDSGGTEIRAETELTLTGRPAQFGQALISDVVDRVLDRFVHGVADQLTARPATTVPEPGAGGGSGTEAGRPDWVESAADETTGALDGSALEESRVAELAVAVDAGELDADDVDTGEEGLDEEPPIDPRGDDADFATVPLTSPAVAEAEPDAAAGPDPVAEAEADRQDEPESTDFLNPVAPAEPARLAASVAGPAPGTIEPAQAPSGLRRYAPAAAAAVAGVTAVVVWAIGRRRR